MASCSGGPQLPLLSPAHSAGASPVKKKITGISIMSGIKDLWCSIVQFGCYQHRHE